jgi:hypothetical protein
MMRGGNDASFALSQWLMGILCPVILRTTCILSPRNAKLAQRRAVGSEPVGHDGGWSDALLLQEFSHQLERRLAVSPWLNQDVEDLAFAVHGTPDVQLSAVDGDISDVAVAQSEAEIEPNGLLNDDARIAVAMVMRACP